jgi:hypothetical protein
VDSTQILQLYDLDDGQTQTLATRPSRGGGRPAWRWSPDSRFWLWVDKEYGSDEIMYSYHTYDRQTDTLTPLDFGTGTQMRGWADEGHSAWFTDGFADGQQALFRYDLATGAREDVLTLQGADPSIVKHPDWLIVLYHNEPPHPQDNTIAQRIYISDRQTVIDQELSIISNFYGIGTPAYRWSPDGRWLMMNATVFDSTNGTLTAAVQGLWSADSRYLVPVQGSLEVDDSIVVWDVVQGAQVFTLAVPDLEMMMGVQGNTIKPVLNYCGIG